MPRLPRISRTALWSALAIMAGLGAWQGLRAQTPPAAPAPAPAPANGTAPAEPPTTPTVNPTPTPADSPTVRIVFVMSPAVNATVTWGKTRLGRIAPGKGLAITRPRDSGPLDVVIRAPGYLTVHTRAHTFADTKLLVKLTPLDQKSTLLGYKAPLDAATPFDPDAGVPPVLTDMPPSLLYTPEAYPNATPAQPAPAPAPAPIAAPPAR